jgi:hypothetical protein
MRPLSVLLFVLATVGVESFFATRLSPARSGVIAFGDKGGKEKKKVRCTHQVPITSSDLALIHTRLTAVVRFFSTLLQPKAGAVKNSGPPPKEPESPPPKKK